MSKKEEIQKKEREECLNNILKSKSTKRIIIAGAGTGKTFTFKKLLETYPSDNNIALTFIRMLTTDMYNSFGDLAEVKTFHAYCKKILHERNGKVDLYPFLSRIINADAKFLGLNLINFEQKFQMLEEDSEEIKFYLKRGDYYDAVSFDDSVYRLYMLQKKDASVLPQFNQILIDEFQDFNPLEVAFIDELEKKGSILIVGDDDQAVYDGRCASSTHLIKKYNSNKYNKFELPFCSRCTEVIVNASNAFLKKAKEVGYLKNRIEKRYECFNELKASDNVKYPKIIVGQCTLGQTVAKYVKSVISQIDQNEIDNSWREGNEYPTLLIVGPRQNLKIIYDKLINEYPQIKYKMNIDNPLSPVTGYEILIKDINNNLGWRLLLDFYMDNDDIKKIIKISDESKPMSKILSSEFLKDHKAVIEIIKLIQAGDELKKKSLIELEKVTKSFSSEIFEYFKPKKDEDVPEFDKTKPSILLTSFVGCKGLSAGFTIIIGANNGSIPKNPRNINNVEISQFLVALTRTRKECHIISNKWLIAPYLNGKRIKASERSIFLEWIPSKFIKDLGEIRARDINY